MLNRAKRGDARHCADAYAMQCLTLSLHNLLYDQLSDLGFSAPKEAPQSNFHTPRSPVATNIVLRVVSPR